MVSTGYVAMYQFIPAICKVHAFVFSQNLSMLQQKFGSLRETGGLAVLVARYLFMRLLCL
jgi:hypothetical protein